MLMHLEAPWLVIFPSTWIHLGSFGKCSSQLIEDTRLKQGLLLTFLQPSSSAAVYKRKLLWNLVDQVRAVDLVWAEVADWEGFGPVGVK